MKNLPCSLLLSVSVPKSRMNLITSLLRRLRGFEHALLLWRSKLALKGDSRRSMAPLPLL